MTIAHGFHPTRRTAAALAAACFALLLASPGPVPAQTLEQKEIETRGGIVGVRIEKSAELAVPLCPGGNVHYTVRIENIGTLAGTGEIFDPIPDGMTFVTGSESNGAFYDAANDRIVWEGPLGPGDEHVIGFSVTVDPGVPNGTIVNRATGRMTVGETVAEIDVEMPVEVECPPLAFEVDKTAHFAQPLACPGGNVFFEIRITNLTDRANTLNGELEDPIPAGTTFEGSLTGGAVYDDATDRVTWEGTLGPGETHTVGFSVTVDGTVEPGDTITNTATVTLSDPQVGDSLEKQAEEAVTCPVPPLDLDVEKTAHFAEPLECPGGNVFFEVRITNLSARQATLNAELTDPIPAGTTFEGSLTEGAVHDAVNDRVTWSGMLGPGDSRTVGFSVTVDDTVSPGEAITNVATVTLSDPELGDSIQEQAQVTVTCPEGGDDDDDDDDDDNGGGDCPIEVIGFVEDSVGNGGSRYPLSSSRVWLFDIEDDPLPVVPLSEQKYEPLREQRTNDTFETGLEDQEFPLPDRAGYEFDFATPDVSQCPPRSAVVSVLWDADDRLAVAPRRHVGGRYAPAYLARCISDVADEVMPAGPCYEWKLDGGTWVPWDPVAGERAQVDFRWGTSPTNAESTRVIHDPATANPPLSENWGVAVSRVPPDVFFQDAAHMYFFSYKAMEYLETLTGEVREALAELAGEGAEPEELHLPPVLLTPHEPHCPGGCAWSKPHLQEDLPAWLPLAFGGLRSDGATVNPSTLIAFNTPYSNSRPFGGPFPANGNKPDNREWHELGHHWMIALYDGDWPGAYRNDTAPCGDDPPDMPPVPDRFGNGNHCGYANETTTDSYIEGFAEFTSMLIADHYDDPKPYLYHFHGNDRNLEVDHRMWGPYLALRGGNGLLTALDLLDPRDEDFAVAGILWDVYDDSDFLEPKALGVLSDAIRLEDRASHPAADVFAHIRDELPEAVAHLTSTLAFNFPMDTDGDGFNDVDEVFIAHGVFDDHVRDLRHDVGENLGGTGSSTLPERIARPAREPIPNGFVEYDVEEEGLPISPAGVALEVEYTFEPPFDDYSYQAAVPATGRLYLNLPPPDYPAELTITAVGGGDDELRSDPLTVTSDQYWSTVAAGAPSVGEHTFALEKDVPEEPDGPALTSPELAGFEAQVRITPQGGEARAGVAEPSCIVESLCVSGALPGRPEVFVKVIGPRPNGKLWTQISRFTPSEVEVWLKQVATGTTRYYRLGPVGRLSDDVSGLQDREAFDPAGIPSSVPRGALLPGAAVEPLPLVSRIAAVGPRLEPGEPEPPEELDWLTTPELPGFRFKALITPAGGQGVGGQEVDLCIPETLCIQGALAGRPEVFAKIIGPRPNGFLWVQAARFTPSRVELWVEQEATGTLRYYRLEPIGPTADDVSGLQDREAFAP